MSHQQFRLKDSDDLNPARGQLAGILLSIQFWLTIGVVAYLRWWA